MPYRDRDDNVCGFLDIETEEGRFCRQFFLLDVKRNVLEYFMDNPMNLPVGAEPVGSFNILYLSLVSDAAKIRAKFPHCFSLTFAGKKHFLCANDINDKEKWIDVLTDAAKVTVSTPTKSYSTVSVDSGVGADNSYKAEVHGGVLVRTPVEGSDSESEGTPDDFDRPLSPWQPHIHKSPIKTGYCIKQGFKRKNWKRRFFVLSADGISYFKSHTKATPIRTVCLPDVTEARLSIGIHPNRENVLEIVTPWRVFYVQTETAREANLWIHTITQAVLTIKKPKKQERGSQTDLAAAETSMSSSASREDLSTSMISVRL